MAISRRLGPQRIAAGLGGIGEVRRASGNHEQARAAYDEAASLARGSHELQVLVPALPGRRGRRSSRHRPWSRAPRPMRRTGWPRRRCRPSPSRLSAGSPWPRGSGRAAALAERSVVATRASRALDLLAEALELADATHAAALLADGQTDLARGCSARIRTTSACTGRSSLVRTGRHGEARRAFDQWAKAMWVVDAPDRILGCSL